MKDLFIAIKNAVEFFRNIGNLVYERFLFNDDFLGFYVVNNSDTFHKHSRSIE